MKRQLNLLHLHSFLNFLTDQHTGAPQPFKKSECRSSQASLFPRLILETPKSRTDQLQLPVFENFFNKEEESLGSNRPFLGPALSSVPDSALTESYFSTKLVHGDCLSMHQLSLDSLLTQNGHTQIVLPSLEKGLIPEADGFIIRISKKLFHTHKAFKIRCGMRTADCLTWVCFQETPHEYQLSFAHLGWRSFTLGLHFKILDQLRRDAGRSERKSSQGAKESNVVHYLSPAIFGRDYPCDLFDVGSAFQRHAESRKERYKLDQTSHENLLAAANRLGLSPCEHQNSTQHSNQISSQNTGNEHKIYPDLQLLFLLDLFAAGEALSQTWVHRVNTATSNVYPSYRASSNKQKETGNTAPHAALNQRLLTLFEWKTSPTRLPDAGSWDL